MSIPSFIRNSVRDPAYPIRRVRWAAWKLTPERDVIRSSVQGRFSFSSKDQTIGRTLYLTGRFAYPDLQKAVDLLARHGALAARDNSILLDIGANIGTVCIPLVREGTFRRCLAFEPETKNLRYLEWNVRANGLEEQIQVLPVGLSSRDTRAVLVKSEINFGDHRIRPSTAEAGAAGASEVTLRSLDGVLREQGIRSEEIALIWMDTQGHEGEIFKGASALLQAGVPCVTEFWPSGLRDSNTRVEDFAALLSEHYSAFFDLGEPEPARRPIHELLDFSRRFPGAEHYTDLVLLPAASG